MLTKPRILFIDIETAPNIVTSWSLWIEGMLSHDNLIQERYIICASWKWAHEKYVNAISINPNDPTNDLEVIRTLHDVISSADAVVAHNGDKFDMRWIHARVLFYKLPPLPPVIQIDTKKIAKSKFYFNSNRLDYLAQYLGVGKKIRTEYDLWKGCMKGDVNSINKMIKYNKHDVLLLEKVFKILKPYVPSKINYQLFTSRDSCTHCGSRKIQYRGYVYTKSNKYRRFQCTSCHAWGRNNKAEPKE